MKSLCKALAVLCLLPLLATCESIIGLPERELVEDGSVAGTRDTALCQDYCTDVMSSCKAPNLDAYTSMDNCLAMCSHMPQGKADASETSKHTASCRAHYAHEASSVESDVKFCPAAAPGGGSPTETTRCGDNCEAYCQLHGSICPDAKQNDCLAKCRALPDSGDFSASNDFMGGDTIQCRLSHLTAAAQAARKDDDAERKTHCGHALLRASLGDRPHCDVPNGTVPNCADYCKLVTQACDEHKVYDDAKQCEKFCDKGLEKGTNTVKIVVKDNDGKDVEMTVQDQTRDTLACRRWHGYYAFDSETAAATHCQHAGPTGDGHCGKPICQVYCTMLARGCDKQFKSEFPMGESQCITACKGLSNVKDADMGYDLGSEEARTDTLQCRFRQLVDAFNDVAGACDRALPKGVCSK